MSTFNAILEEFSDDTTVRLISALVLLDILVGVCAAIVDKTQKFQLNYIVDFLRNDVLGKMIPYFGIWAAVRLGGDIEIAGFGAIEELVGAGVVAALGASIAKSLVDLGLLKGLSGVFGGDPRTPSP